MEDKTAAHDLQRLHHLAVRYHKFKEAPSQFLEYLAAQPQERMEAFREYQADGVTITRDGIPTIRSVAFCRLVITDRLLAKEDVSLSDIEELEQAIANGRIDDFAGYPDLLDRIGNLPKVSGDPFKVWTPFKILFYIDYFHEREGVKALLDSIADLIRTELHLNDFDYHLAGFDFNNNFGTDRCWCALYPEAAGGHKKSYQLFLGVYPEHIGFGLAKGSELGEWPEEEDFRRYSSAEAVSLSEVLAYHRELFPKLTKLNREATGGGPSSAEPRHPLNLVFYGPPGTGKTYTAQLRAAEIVEGRIGDGVEEFRDLVKDGRVEVVTFHPSYSYEEFVEGFRYSEESEKPTLHDGIFKRLASRAISPVSKAPPEGAEIWKISLGDASEEHIFTRCMEAEEIAIGWFPKVDFSGMTGEDIEQEFENRGCAGETNNIRSVNYFVNEIQDGDLVAVRSDNRNIRAIGVVDGAYQHRSDYEEYTHVRPVRWLDKKQHDIYEMNKSKNLTMPTVYRLKHVPLQDFVDLIPTRPQQRPYVLIIDEINRGNLSRIFGELITLLEPDKRRGAEHEMSVRLPYSNETFTVPPNLHVIGTMNTADRSIALLDVALRRRFEFEELMPQVSVIRQALTSALDSETGGFDLSADQIDLICHVFGVINKRITVLLDRDHQIGHSVFMKIRSAKDLHEVFYRNVVPLLQEYFYNDRRRLIDVLGEYDPGHASGFIRSLDGDFKDAVGHLTLDRESMPWEVHRYPSGVLEDVLRRTF